MNYETKFTERVRTVIRLARQEAQSAKSQFIGTEHLLTGIMLDGGGVAARVLQNYDVDLKKLRDALAKVGPPSLANPEELQGSIPYAPRTKRVFEVAGEFSFKLGHEVIGTEHVLVAIAKDPESIGAMVLTTLGIQPAKVIDDVLFALGADVTPQVAISKDAPCKHRRLNFSGGGMFVLCDGCDAVWLGVQSVTDHTPNFKLGLNNLTDQDFRFEK